MSGSAAGYPLLFLFDQHMNRPALLQLRTRGIDLVHTSEVGLAEADDAEIMVWARNEGRIVVTRNYRDFAPLVHAFEGSGEHFPGVLFCPTSIRHSDVGAHVRALEQWIASARAVGGNPARNGYDWLR